MAWQCKYKVYVLSNLSWLQPTMLWPVADLLWQAHNLRPTTNNVTPKIWWITRREKWLRPLNHPIENHGWNNWYFVHKTLHWNQIFCGNPICNNRDSAIDTERTARVEFKAAKCKKLIKSSHLICFFVLLWSDAASLTTQWTRRRTKHSRRHMKILHQLFVSSINKHCQFHRQLRGTSKSKWPLVNYVNAIMFCRRLRANEKKEKELSTLNG